MAHPLSLSLSLSLSPLHPLLVPFTRWRARKRETNQKTQIPKIPVPYVVFFGGVGPIPNKNERAKDEKIRSSSAPAALANCRAVPL